MKRSAADRIRRSRIELVLSRPFFGNLALHLVPTETREPWCTFATDGRRFYYDPEYIDRLSDPELLYALAHSVLHLALDHFGRRGGRDPARWDRAIDLAVDSILLAPPESGGEGMTAPPPARDPESCRGLPAEEIYRRLPPEEAPREGPDQHLAGANEAAPRVLDREIWRRRAITARSALSLAGKLPAALARPLERSIESVVPWHEILARFVHASFRNDYRLPPPNRRFVGRGLFLPSMRADRLELVVAVDTSASIPGEVLDRFAAEMRGILASLPSYGVELLAADAAISSHVRIESPNVFELAPLAGGGGTDFRPVFERVESEGWSPDLAIYMTDGEGPFPDREPEFPVLWLVPPDTWREPDEGTGRPGRAAFPFGEALRIPSHDERSDDPARPPMRNLP